MTSTRRYWVSVTAVSILALVLTACAGDGAGQSPGASPAGSPAASPGDGDGDGGPAPTGTTLVGGCTDEATTVTFWTTHTSPTDIAGLTSIVEAFNEQGGQCAEMVQVPGDETTIERLVTAVRGGVGPDVYMLDRFTVAERAAAGALTELPQAAELEDQFLEFAWAEVIFEGTPYGLPFDTDARALWYRSDVLEAAGADISALDPEQGPATLEEIRAIHEAVTTQDGDAYDTMGFIPWLNQGWHYTWGFAHGGNFADLEGCQVTPTDEGVVAGYQFVYDWAESYDPEMLRTWEDTYHPEGLADPQNPLYKPADDPGVLAMVISGDWVISHIEQYLPDGAALEATWVPVPNEGDESQTWAGGWSLVTPQGASNPEGGYELIQFMAGAEGQRIYTEETAHMPTLRELVDDDSLYEGQHQFFRQLLDVANSRPALPVGALYWDELTRALRQVQRNEAQPDEALQRVQDTVQPELEQFCPIV